MRRWIFSFWEYKWDPIVCAPFFSFLDSWAAWVPYVGRHRLAAWPLPYPPGLGTFLITATKQLVNNSGVLSSACGLGKQPIAEWKPQQQRGKLLAHTPGGQKHRQGQASALLPLYHTPLYPFYDLSPPDGDIHIWGRLPLSSSSTNVPQDMSKVCISDVLGLESQSDWQWKSTVMPSYWVPQLRRSTSASVWLTMRRLGSIIGLKVILILIKIKNITLHIELLHSWQKWKRIQIFEQGILNTVENSFGQSPY